jgi:hypothetical protein
MVRSRQQGMVFLSMLVFKYMMLIDGDLVHHV